VCKCKLLCEIVDKHCLEWFTDASKTGVAHEATQTIKRGLTIGEAEARQILGVTEKSSWDEILKVCLHTSPRAGCANANSGL